MASILILAAHPDDEVLGCAVAIQRHRERGDAVFVEILTDGGAGRYGPEGAAALAQAAQRAGSLLGAGGVRIASFPNQGLETRPLWDLTRHIEAVIEEHGADCVYTHHRGDLNRDHRLVWEATVTACRPHPAQRVGRVLCYFVPSSSEWLDHDPRDAFQPQVLLTAEQDHLERKIAAMACYESESRPFPHPRSPEALRHYATHWGLRFGTGPGEPFVLWYDRRGDLG